MFLAEMVVRAIHADRERAIERASRDRRFLAEIDEQARLETRERARVAPSKNRAACGDSAGVPA